MTTKISAHVIDNGLVTISAATVNYAIFQTEPTSLADCTSLSGAGGKRISAPLTINSGTITLSNGINANSRNLTIPSLEHNSAIDVAVSGGSVDLWVALYDDSNLLLVSDQITNRDLALDATVITPEITFGVQQ